jgi:putative nucleotidyltransferase with HDIG domain
MPVLLAKRLDQIKDLPAMPNTLHQVLEALDRVTASAKTLERIVEQDPVLTAKILRLASSPYYSASGEVSSISKAVVTLGFEEVRNLVIGLSLTGVFSDDLGFEEFDSKGLWLHSMGVATASRLLAERIPDLASEELFTAGLVHDLGRFLVCLYFADELREILSIRRTEGISLFAAEEQCGITHASVGAYLAQKWGLSDMLTNVIRYHHRPHGAGPHTKAASVVFLADELCQKINLGWSITGEVKKVLIPKTIGLSAEIIRDVVPKLREKKEQIEACWGSLLTT